LWVALITVAGHAQHTHLVYEKWNSGKFADKSYQALERARAVPNEKLVIGKGDFYYQLYIRHNWEKAAQGDCGYPRPSGLRYLNATTADIFLNSELQERVEGVTAVPIFVVGNGIDPGSGTKINGCRVRPGVSQYWKLARYEGTDLEGHGERYSIRLNLSLAQSKSWSTLLPIISAVAKVPAIAGGIPPGISDVTQKILEAQAAASATPTDFRDVEIAAVQTHNAVLRLVIKEHQKAGQIDIFVRRIGSKILDRSTKARDIIRTTLRKDDKGKDERFLPKFLAANDAFAKERPDPAKDGGKAKLVDFCQKAKEFAESDMALSTIDQALIRRSILIDYKYDKTISEEEALGSACWSRDDERFARAIMVPDFVKTPDKVEKFGSY
jgi:hypothetical protein